MQYAIPQFTDVEDKLIGPLTLKQFLMALGVGLIELLFWSIFKFGVMFFLIGLPIFFLGLGIIFGKLNERPMYAYLFPMWQFLSKPKVRVFRREMINMSFMKTKPKEQRDDTPKKTFKHPGSKLKQLAYILDQKVTQEEELLGIDTKKISNI
jgi:hypothetical protein